MSKKLGSSAKVSSTAAHPPRQRTSLLLSSGTNGSEQGAGAASPPSAAMAVAQPMRRSGTKSRASVSYVSLSAHQATAAASSGDAHPPHVGTKVPAVTAKTVSGRPRAVAAIPANHTAPPPPGARESVPPNSSPAAAAAVPNAPLPGSSPATPTAGAVRRARFGTSTPSITAPSSIVEAPGVLPEASNGSSKTDLPTLSPRPPSLPISKLGPHHADVDSNRTAVPPASAGSWTAKPQGRCSLSGSGPRRLSSSSSNAIKATSSAPAPAAAPSTSTPEVAAAQADIRVPLAARQRGSALTAVNSKPRRQSRGVEDPSTDSIVAPLASPPSVVQVSLKSRQSVSVIGKKKVMRRASTGTAPSQPPSAATSRRPSVSCAAMADNTVAPTRDPSVVHSQSQNNCSTAPTFDAEGTPSTTLITARTSGRITIKTPTNPSNTASADTVTPLVRGPVVSEEWARSIIKPGDENLLYQATAARTTFSRFAYTPSGMSMGGGAASAAWQPRSTGRNSINDTQLRRAQAAVLRLRNAETPTPGWRSTKAVSVGAASAVSVASGGSGSRFGSTVKRSGTRLRHRQEDEDRQRLLTKTTVTPAGGNGESVDGGRASNTGTAVGSASPTPSRISEASANTMMRGGGRLSGCSAHTLFEQLSGGATAPADAMGQRCSTSLKLFAKPSPRAFSTPSPRGSTGTPGLKTTFSVSSGPYYAGNEELTRLTCVREEMLLALMQSSAPSAAPAVMEENSASATVSSTGCPKVGSDADALEGFASSALTIHVDPEIGKTVLVSSAPPVSGKRPRQRVYSVDLHSSASNESAPPKQSPAADATQPRGRLASSATSPMLASSIRQKPGNSVVASRLAPPGATVGTGATPPPTSARPTLDSSAIASGAPPVALAAAAAARQQRRTGVTVSMSSLQSPNTVAEQLRLALVRQEQQRPVAVRARQIRAAAPSSVPITNESPVATPSDAATRLLLLDPLFPIVSEENYQRLVLQNDEYTARRVLLAHMSGTQPAPLSTSRSHESPPPVPPLDMDRKCPRSGAEVPPAARALEIDLAEAEEVAPSLSLTVAALTSTRAAPAAAPPSPTTSPFNAATNGSTQPRRPSVQYGGPALYAAFSPPRLPSPPPAASGVTSPTAGAAVGLGGPTSSTCDGKLLVNSVMPTEKSGSVKVFAPGCGWYAPTPMSELTRQSTAQLSLSASLLVSGGGGGAVGGANNSPIRMHSTSPTASCSSLRNATRRGSLLRNVQQHLQPQAKTAITSSCSDSTDDEDSTASDEAVDLAEVELCKLLPLWGPFRTSHAASPPQSDVVQQECATKPRTVTGDATTGVVTTTAACTTKKSAHGETPPVVLPTRSTPSRLPTAPVLLPAMTEELQAYVHLFLKRYRDADAAGAKDMGPIPETPLALQRAIRRSLRLSAGRSANAADDEDAVELEDPLDDGSYHSQNVQYVLDLLGSLLQVETSFCEDDAAQATSDARSLAAAPQRHTKKRVSGTQLIEAVMGKHTSLSSDGTAGGVLPKYTKTTAARAAVKRPVLKLRDPELRAVELMFIHDAP